MTIFEQTVAEVSISYSHKTKPSLQKQITGSRDVYELVSPSWPDLDYRERFAILILSRSNRVLGVSWISNGGVTGTVVDVKIVMQTLLKANACAFICIHNHPSGTLSASTEDRKLTEKLKNAAKLFDISLLDHLILTSEQYYSFADEGIL